MRAMKSGRQENNDDSNGKHKMIQAKDARFDPRFGPITDLGSKIGETVAPGVGEFVKRMAGQHHGH